MSAIDGDWDWFKLRTIHGETFTGAVVDAGVQHISLDDSPEADDNEGRVQEFTWDEIDSLERIEK